MYVEKGATNDDPPLPLETDLDEKNRKEMEEKKKPMKGVLFINIPMARGLKAVDSSTKTSDPYVEIYYPNKEKPNKTNVIDKNLDPIWNYQSTYRIDILKEKYVPIKFNIKDHNGFTSDDTLGFVNIDWMPLFE